MSMNYIRVTEFHRASDDLDRSYTFLLDVFPFDDANPVATEDAYYRAIELTHRRPNRRAVLYRNVSAYGPWRHLRVVGVPTSAMPEEAE